MKWVELAEINTEQWEAWCQKSTESQPFLSLDYLRSVSRQLAFVVNADESGGMPLPYFEKWGVRTLYTPVFCRWVDWVGANPPTAKELLGFLQGHFRQADVYVRRELLGTQSERLVFQTLDKTNYVLNQQAKRKLKKWSNTAGEITFGTDAPKAVQFLRNELQERIVSLSSENFDSLEVLTSKLLNNNSLIQLNLTHENQLEGVLFLVRCEHRLLYLKGTCAPNAKKNGGMYALMDAAIQMALKENLLFDFGGSRVDGVRRFNLCFGAKDEKYYRYSWDKGPAWYTLLKTVKKKWRKK